MEFVTFPDADLPYESNDRMVWRYAQENNMIFLTENRNMSGRDSLEQTLREENTKSSMPVLAIGNVNRMVEKNYRKKYATSTPRQRKSVDLRAVSRQIRDRHAIGLRS